MHVCSAQQLVLAGPGRVSGDAGRRARKQKTGGPHPPLMSNPVSSLPHPHSQATIIHGPGAVHVGTDAAGNKYYERMTEQYGE